MLRPIFYTFCNLTEDKEDSSRRVRAWNEQVLEDRIVDEWNWEWIDKTFSFFSFLFSKKNGAGSKRKLQIYCNYVSSSKNTRKRCGRRTSTRTQIWRIHVYTNIFHLIYNLFEIYQIFLTSNILISVQRIINKIVARLRLRIHREFS